MFFLQFKLYIIGIVLINIDDNQLFRIMQRYLTADLASDRAASSGNKDYLAGKNYAPSNIEEASPFSKVIFLILQEFSFLKDDYKRFAQNIYQSKLLACDLHQYEIELFCDLLIAYSYSKIGIQQKAISIYNDVLKTAEKSAMFNVLALARYFISILKISSGNTEEALILINDTLALIQKYNNQSKIIYALFEKLYIQTVKDSNLTAVDIESEEQKLLSINIDDSLVRILN